MAKDPENAEIYRLALKVAQELKKQGFVTKTMEARQVIYHMIAPVLKGKIGAGEGATTIADDIQRFMDNPMTPEEESRALRAILHSGLSKGDISPQILDKLDRIIGVSSGDDETIMVVDFSEAFPDLATAVRVTTEILAAAAR